jgi:hypothetical protein
MPAGVNAGDGERKLLTPHFQQFCQRATYVAVSDECECQDFRLCVKMELLE